MESNSDVYSEKTFMIAEDEPINYMLLQKMLEKTKAKVIWAKNGEEALSKVTEGIVVDLILMDIRMPKMDGIEATMAIRKIKPDLPIVAVTAYTLSNEREKCSEAGTTAFLTKPVRPGELFPLLHQVIV